VRYTLEIHAARMRLRNSPATLAAVLRRPARTDQEAADKTAAIAEYWKQLRNDKELVYGPTPNGYPLRVRREQNPLL
jgi:hypothetical protein